MLKPIIPAILLATALGAESKVEVELRAMRARLAASEARLAAAELRAAASAHEREALAAKVAALSKQGVQAAVSSAASSSKSATAADNRSNQQTEATNQSTEAIMRAAEDAKLAAAIAENQGLQIQQMIKTGNNSIWVVVYTQLGIIIVGGMGFAGRWMVSKRNREWALKDAAEVHQHMIETRTAVVEIATNTNSMKDQLVKLASEKAYKEGLKDGTESKTSEPDPKKPVMDEADTATVKKMSESITSSNTQRDALDKEN